MESNTSKVLMTLITMVVLLFMTLVLCATFYNVRETQLAMTNGYTQEYVLGGGRMWVKANCTNDPVRGIAK